MTLFFIIASVKIRLKMIQLSKYVDSTIKIDLSNRKVNDECFGFDANSR